MCALIRSATLLLLQAELENMVTLGGTGLVLETRVVVVHDDMTATSMYGEVKKYVFIPSSK